MTRQSPSGRAPVIALDGLSGSGKSTLARELSRRLEWAYLNSGAWYRALAWACKRAGADPGSSQAVMAMLSGIRIEGRPDGSVAVDGKVLREELRTPEIDRAVPDVADHAAVRRVLVGRMRGLREQEDVAGIVAEGRDAATCIFPDADLKVFVDADLDVRARRRLEQRRRAGHEHELERVIHDLEARDARDAARGESAPRPVAGGKILDNPHLSVEEAIGRLLTWAAPLKAAVRRGC